MTEDMTIGAWGRVHMFNQHASGPQEVTMLPTPLDRTELKVGVGWDKLLPNATTTAPNETVTAYRTEPPAETDPNGKSLNEPGAKGDAGKLRPALVLGGFARALLAVTRIGTDGAKKYSDAGWLDVPNGIARYEEALMRHWLKEKAGEKVDSDTNCLHAAHFAWNALARLDLILREVGHE